MSGSTMMAVVLHRTGGPEVLSYEEIDRPRPAPGELLVEVDAVSVNQTLDVQIRSGATSRGVRLPHILGVDPAGRVAALGDGVDGFTVGQHVVVTSAMWCGSCPACRRGAAEDCAATEHIGVHRNGGYAQFVAVPAGNVHATPPHLDAAQASVLMRHAPTALNLLESKAGLQEGETVLVMGASGGLGSTGLQIAKLLGATVIACAGTPERLGTAMALGADHGVAYRQTSLAKAVAELTDGSGVDVVFENVGDPELWPEVVASMARSGRLVTAGAHAGGHVELDLHQLYRRRLRLIGGAGHRPADIGRALELASGGRLVANIALRSPLSRAADAHRLAESRSVAGKIVLEPQEG
jgi:NADPH:quinone reductase-like Zn-dependent oxidoreductase